MDFYTGEIDYDDDDNDDDDYEDNDDDDGGVDEHADDGDDVMIMLGRERRDPSAHLPNKIKKMVALIRLRWARNAGCQRAPAQQNQKKMMS